MCERHGILSVITRVPEHDTLVARIDVKVILADVHIACNLRTLLVDADQYLAILEVQSLADNAAQVVNEGIKSDVPHNAPHHGLVVNSSSMTMLSFTPVSYASWHLGSKVRQASSTASETWSKISSR